MIWSQEFEDALRDGDDEALRLVLAEAVKRDDLQMIARIVRILNERKFEHEPVT